MKVCRTIHLAITLEVEYDSVDYPDESSVMDSIDELDYEIRTTDTSGTLKIIDSAMTDYFLNDEIYSTRNSGYKGYIM